MWDGWQVCNNNACLPHYVCTCTTQLHITAVDTYTLIMSVYPQLQEFSDGGAKREKSSTGVNFGAWSMGVANYSQPRGGKMPHPPPRPPE